MTRWPIAPQFTPMPVARLTPMMEKTRIWIVEVGIRNRVKNVVTAKPIARTMRSAVKARPTVYSLSADLRTRYGPGHGGSGAPRPGLRRLVRRARAADRDAEWRQPRRLRRSRGSVGPAGRRGRGLPRPAGARHRRPDADDDAGRDHRALPPRDLLRDPRGGRRLQWEQDRGAARDTAREACHRDRAGLNADQRGADGSGAVADAQAGGHRIAGD